ncbi:MAG: hypothetical protein LZF62_140006 [Nitrospira sp.]|nr:MAG: hypothetical protein LZF62_140006 [Nitrospira sp.]
MIRLYADAVFSGDTFSPRLAESITGLTFSTKNEPGEIGSIGRYKGLPRPYGMAILKAPFDSATMTGSQMPEEWIADALTQHIKFIRSCGATEIHVSITVAWKGQCNLGFRKDFLSKIGQLNVPMSVSCYEGDHKEIKYEL